MSNKMANLKPWVARWMAEERRKAQKQKPDTAPVLKQPEIDGKHFSFLDLSAELRNAIYEYSLSVPGKIMIRRASRFNQDTGRYDEYWTSNHDSSLSPNLLATCKTVRKEGTPMLYGLNHFTLKHSSGSDVSSNAWSKIIGASVKHLRFVTLSSTRTQVILKSILEDLKGATRLENLVMDHWCWNNFRSVSTMSSGLYPLMLHLHIHRRSSGKKSVLEVLQVWGWEGEAVKETLGRYIGL